MKVTSIEKQMMDQRISDRYPFEQQYLLGSAYIDGKICPITEAKIPLYDMGFMQADAVYEKATVSNGRFFRLKDHMDRFDRSCRKFRLRNPYSEEETITILADLVRLTGLKSAGVFWCVTRGLATEVAKDRNNPDAYDNCLYAMVSQYSSVSNEQDRMNGLDILVSQQFIRTPPQAIDPTAKNFNWSDMKLSLFEARDQGKEWSVLLDRDDHLTEAPGANIFIVKDGNLYTPDCGCLEGITRQSALELAEMLAIPSYIESVHVDRLREADEAFLTSSAGGIMPIRSVDSVVFGDGKPGKITTKLHNLYWNKMWDGWKGTEIEYKHQR